MLKKEVPLPPTFNYDIEEKEMRGAFLMNSLTAKKEIWHSGPGGPRYFVPTGKRMKCTSPGSRMGGTLQGIEQGETRSGKIMRRLLKAKELGLPSGDTSTMEED